MADNTLVLCGGTGAHVALAYLRLHFLGAALGYFRGGDGKLAVFPELFLVDQDAGDGSNAGSTAWQMVRFLVEHHPGRMDRASRMGRNEPPSILEVRPLPVGRKNEWYRPPHDSLQGRFGSSPLLPVLFAEKQRLIEYSKGMMGSPALGSMLFKLKEYDERETGVNNDEVFGELLRKEGRIVVAGSGVGGTGASVTPTLARRLADKRGNSVMAAILLSWFKFDEQVADPVLRERAAIKNRILQQNAHSALEFCGQSLARHVATVPIGMPEGSLVLREFTGDFAQPICESFAHYVAALAGFRHFTSENPYGQGLFAMGALGRGKLDGPTAIPGGTLQDLVNRAATLVDLLGVWSRMLKAAQTDRIVPALYGAIRKLADPVAVANALEEEAGRYKEQLDEVAAVLDLKPQIQGGLSFEQRCRDFLAKKALETGPEPSPLRTALALFYRAADQVSEAASEQNLLKLLPGHPQTSHWPDLHSAGITIPVRQNGDLNMVPEGNIAVVLQAIVSRECLSANGWPHPLAAADFFKDAIRQRDSTAWRQLEILLVGVASGQLEAREIEIPAAEEAVSLEAVVREYERREGFEGIARLGIYRKNARGEERLIAFSSPFTVLAPLPFLDDAADNALWQELWETLSGAANGESWKTAEAPLRWREERAVWLVRSWLARERSTRGEDGPSWSQLFAGLPAHPPVSVGIGKGLRVYWRGSQLVDVSLPHSGNPNWIPEASVPEREATELRRHLPELAAVESFSEVDFEMPNVGLVHAWWREHLDELRQSGRIFAFGQLPDRQVAIGTLVGGTVHKTIFSGSLILDRPEIAIQKVTPLEQRPIFGEQGTAAGARRFPDIPLKAEYFGLVADAGRPLLAVAKTAESFRDFRSPAIEKPDPAGRPLVTWRLPVLGRRDPLNISISLVEEPVSAAHWMVWPRFRSADPARWRTYYLYDYCRNPSLVCDVLWLEGTSPGVSRLQLKERQSPFPRMEPLRYSTQQDSRAHTGGPPLALCLRNHRTGEQRGLYLVPLEVLREAEIRLNLAIDFGTSHSVVAIEQGAERTKKVVKLAPELDPAARSRALSLHVSEDREHLSEDGGLEESGNWMPNYRKKAGNMVPSELLLYRTLNQATGDDLAAWVPLQHYTIPPLDLSRGDLGELIVSGFKWDASSSHFQGREPQLREHYQSLLLELALADVVANELRNIPSGNVGVTFCYPLRSQREQILALRSAIDVVLRRTASSTGIRTVAYDEIGILDESRAAAVRREQAGEVCLVADLGGGTLDVLISGYDAQRRRLDEVADSVRLGGNLLLREMIQASASYMPRNGGWDDYPESKLNAWIRGKGAASLWGPDAGSKPRFAELNVTGFERPAEANLARQVINRYFSLIVDFLARNLAAYLTGVWYQKVLPVDHGCLSVSVQLRGNGWRLRYQSEGENERNQAVQEMVRRRLAALWEELPDDAKNLPLPTSWLESGGYSSVEAKTASAMGAVGEAMSHEEVRSRWHTCTLVEVEVLRDNGVQPVPWIARVPFDTGGLNRVQLTRVWPAVPIDPAGVERPVVIRGLDAELQGHVNRALQSEGRLDETFFAAPVSAEVWETLFRVPQFWPHKQGAR